MTSDLWPVSCDTNLFIGGKYVIFKWLLEDARWNCIPSEDHNVKGFLSGPLSLCLTRPSPGTCNLYGEG